MEGAKLGWFASKSTGVKVGLILAAVTVVGAIGYGVYHFAFKDKAIDPAKKDETKTTTDEKAIVDTKIPPTETHVEQPHLGTPDLTLPNKGVGCSSPVTTYDRDYDYVKCNGIWWTRSKAAPATPAAKGKYPNWVSLEKNEVATKLLNTRYPNIK